MAHTNLESYFRINFALMQHHKYSLTDIENMMPWEKEVYVTLLTQYIERGKLKTTAKQWMSHLQYIKILRQNVCHDW